MNLLRRMLIAVLVMLLLAAAPAAAQRIVAVGDLHGDYDAFLDIVGAAGLSDKKSRWTGGEAVLVQLGDVTDRGPDSLKIIRHLQALEQAAPKSGGKVFVLVGNHEAMNVTGDLRYVHPGEYAAFATRGSPGLRDRVYDANRDAILAHFRQSDAQTTPEAARRRWLDDTPPGKLEHRQAWSPRGKLGQWIGAKPAIVRLGGTLFVHGGISVETAARPIRDINAEVSARLTSGERSAGSILTDEFGPLWYRGNVHRDPVKPMVEGEAPTPPRPSIEAELAQVLTVYGARRLVIAHTPNPAGIVAEHGGRLVRIDTGISTAYGGVHSYLELKDGLAMAWAKDGGGKWASQVLPSPP